MGRIALKPRPRGWTIADFMRVPIGLALLIWLARSDPARHPFDLGLLIVLGVALVTGLLARLFFARRCPACGHRRIGRVAMRAFGLHYLRCSECGQRMKRYPWAGSTWDASGPEDDAFFEPKFRPVMTWGDEPRVGPVVTPQTRTVAGLLRGKLDREASAPDPVAIAAGDVSWLGGGPGPPPPARPARWPRLGVKRSVAAALFRTWDAIRWSRNSPR